MAKTNVQKVIQKLYGGEVDVTFYPKAHRFNIIDNGEKVTGGFSVTAVTGQLDKSKPLVIWATRLDFSWLRQQLEKRTGEQFTVEELYPMIDEAQIQHEVQKEKALTIGDNAHDWAERFSIAKRTGAETPELPDAETQPEEFNAVTAMLEWYHENNVSFHESERLLYSRKERFFGFTDVIATVNGMKLLIDYKAANGIYDEYRYQTAGYQGSYEEETGEKLDGRMCLRFAKEPKPGQPVFEAKLYEPDSFEPDYQVFLDLLNVKRRQAAVSVWRGKP